MARRRQLIVHADDLGADQGRNDGIFEALEAGVATAASIIANGPAVEDALRRARRLLDSGRREVSFGVHVNLSEGRPLSTGLARLVGAGGDFPGKRAARRTLAGRDPAVASEVGRETRAQIARIAAEVPVDHLDGHQHVQLFAGARRAILDAADAAGIHWVRGLRGVDHFRGLSIRGEIGIEQLCALVAALPDGLTELMVHPGRIPQGGERSASDAAARPFAAFATAARESELAALLDQRFAAALVDAQIDLISFPR